MFQQDFEYLSNPRALMGRGWFFLRVDLLDSQTGNLGIVVTGDDFK